MHTPTPLLPHTQTPEAHKGNSSASALRTVPAALQLLSYGDNPVLYPSWESHKGRGDGRPFKGQGRRRETGGIAHKKPTFPPPSLPSTQPRPNRPRAPTRTHRQALHRDVRRGRITAVGVERRWQGVKRQWVVWSHRGGTAYSATGHRRSRLYHHTERHRRTCNTQQAWGEGVGGASGVNVHGLRRGGGKPGHRTSKGGGGGIGPSSQAATTHREGGGHTGGVGWSGGKHAKGAWASAARTDDSQSRGWDGGVPKEANPDNRTQKFPGRKLPTPALHPPYTRKPTPASRKGRHPSSTKRKGPWPRGRTNHSAGQPRGPHE